MAKSTFNIGLYLALVVCSFDVVSAQELRKPAPYDFRHSDQYRALDETSRSRLATVVNDLEQLERALDSFMKDHDGVPPEKLEELVPKYLDRLPEDPFAAPDDKIPDYLKHHQRSLDGRGYLYLQGSAIRAWHPYFPGDRGIGERACVCPFYVLR